MAVTKAELLQTLAKYRVAQALCDDDKYLAKEDAANLVPKQIVLSTETSTTEGAVWLIWE